MVEKHSEPGAYGGAADPEANMALSKQQSLAVNEDELIRQEAELKKLEQECEERKCNPNSNQSNQPISSLVKEGEEGELVESGEQASQNGGADGEGPKNDPDESSVFVKNVDYGADDDAIREHFKLCGEITRVTIRKNHHTQQPLG